MSLPTYLKLLCTHLGQESTPLNSGDYILPETNSPASDLHYVQSDFRIYGDSFDTSVGQEITYDNYIAPFTVSQPVFAFSATRLDATIPISKYVVRSGMQTGLPLQYRKITYDRTVDNPVMKDTTELTLEQAPEVSNQYSDFIYKSILKLPNTIGVLSRVISLPIVDDYVDWDSIVGDVLDSTERILLPESRSGYLAGQKIDDSMDETTPEAVGFGILMAACADEKELLVSNLLEFVHQAEKREWISVDENRIVQVNTNPVWGFEPTFSIIDTYTTLHTKELAPNAFLGVCLCIALQQIQDRGLLDEVSLNGSYDLFKEKLVGALSALARFVSLGISPITHWVAYKYDSGMYSYDAPSLSASFLADFFLSMYLDLHYESSIHVRAAKLHLVIQDSEINLKSVYYQSFIERDAISIFHSYEPDFLRNTSITYELITAYFRLLAASYKIWWCIQHTNVDDVIDLMEQYETDRAYLVAETSVTEFYSDYIVILGYKAVHQLNEELMGMPLNAYYSGSIINLVLSGSTPIPDWAQSLISTITPQVNGSSIPTEWFYKLGSIYLFDNNYPLLRFKQLNLNSFYGHSKFALDLTEFRRMMPYGYHWFTEEKINSPNSAIGSIIVGHSNPSFDFWLKYLIVYNSASPLTAQGDFINLWFVQTIGIDLLASGTFLSKKMSTFLKRDRESLEGYRQLLIDFFEITPTIYNTVVPPFSELIDFTLTDDDVSGYGPVVSQWGDFVTRGQFYAITYKKQAGVWVNRQVAGFPVPNTTPVPSGWSVVSISNYLANPRDRVLVSDGDMNIYPLRNYIGRINIDIGNILPNQISKVTRDTLPAGYWYTILSTNSLAGDY